MAIQTLTLADAILKDLYVGPIVEQLNYKTYMLDQIERDSDHIDHTGRRAVVPVHKNRNRGRVSIGDGGTLPTAGRQDWLDAYVAIRYHAYGISLTDQSIEATKRNEGAFINLLDAETQGVAKDMRKDLNRQVFGTGDGVLAYAVSNASAVVTVDSVQYLQVGDVVDLVVASSGATTNGVLNVSITARDATAKTVTLSSAPAGAVGSTYAFYLSNGVAPASGGSSRNKEMDGLRNIINIDRSLHSIDSSTAGNEFWDGQVINVGTNATTTAVAGESSFEQLADNVGAGGNGEVEVFLTSRGIRRRLADTYQSQKRFNDAQAVNVHGGYSAIMVNEIPVIADDDCPKQDVFGINKGSFKWFQQSGPGWLESKDGTVFQLQPNTVGTSATYNAVWLAWFKWYAAMACVAPNRNGRLRYCTDDDPS